MTTNPLHPRPLDEASRRAALVIAVMALAFFTTSTLHADVVQSRFVSRVPISPEYGKAENWTPAEVPNNTDARQYDVTIDPDYSVTVDVDATISNLTLAGTAGRLFSTGLYLPGTTFTVTGATLNFLRGPGSSVSIEGGSKAAMFDAGTLSAFTGSILQGNYDLAARQTAATLRFRAADVVELRDARLQLRGAFTNVVDENGNDGLRNLRRIGEAATLLLDGRNFTTSGAFTNDGSLELGTYGGNATIFTVTDSLTNYDPASRTLTGGTFALGYLIGDAPAPAELRFPGADIVNNGSSISLAGPAARITDLTGLDALRNLARNLAGATLTLQARDFVTLGDFTNDGTLGLSSSNFIVTGALTNFDPAARTLRGGTYALGGGELRFRGADIVHNGALITLGAGRVVDEFGNDGLRNVAENLSTGGLIIFLNRDFATSGSFANAGAIQTFAAGIGIPENPPRASSFTVPRGSTYTQTAGTTQNDGALTADQMQILGGSLRGTGVINANVQIVDALAYPGGLISGSLALSAESRVRSVIGEYSTVGNWRVGGDVTLAGTLEVEITSENFLASDAVLTVIQTRRSLTGAFRNAAHGTRITTIDGSGSFVVLYDATSVKLTGFQANPPSAQLLNISSRGYLKAGDDSFGNRYLIAGFIVTGSEAKTVLVRGLGPSLAKRSVAGPLSDPRMSLRTGRGEAVATNSDWRDTQQAEIEATGLAPEDAREAAIKATLEPGAYTVVVEETNGGPGVALVEVYDLSASAHSKLGNISTRAFVERGGVLIGGIIAGGVQANADLVVRAVRLSFSDGGFTPMENPTLEVRDRDGTLVALSDDGDRSGEAGPVPREFDGAGEAVRVSLPAAHYTALVREKNGGGGTTLVEFYDLRR